MIMSLNQLVYVHLPALIFSTKILTPNQFQSQDQGPDPNLSKTKSLKTSIKLNQDQNQYFLPIMKGLTQENLWKKFLIKINLRIKSSRNSCKNRLKR